MTSKPYGYKEIPLNKQKENEYKVGLLLYPFIKEKNEEFRDSEIEFLACWLHYFDFKEVRVRDLMFKMYSNTNLNYEIINHFKDLGIVEQATKGLYKLSDKAKAALDRIQQELSKIDLSYISKLNKQELKKSNEGE
jgi:hypothetical protein